ncbi:MAG: hypothetical protein HYT87_00240 [Nitrospirae bacterium]|nr:hypothetical protein [Nitrospirota bacterium]
MIPETFEANGIRWGFCFLMADARLSSEERLSLVQHAATMFFNDEKERILDLQAFSGWIRTNNEHDVVGNFGGRRYDAELETPKGKVAVRFLIKELTQKLPLGFSKN